MQDEKLSNIDEIYSSEDKADPFEPPEIKDIELLFGKYIQDESK